MMSEAPPGIYLKKQKKKKEEKKKKLVIVAYRPLTVQVNERTSRGTHTNPQSRNLSADPAHYPPRLKRRQIEMEIEGEGRKKEGKGRGEYNTLQGGCQVRQPRTRGWNNADVPAFLPTGRLFGRSPPLVFLPGDERKKGKKKKNTPWVKWCEKERLRAVATFAEEMAFLWRRRPLSFTWWDGGEAGSELKKVWKRRRYGGRSRSKGRWARAERLGRAAGAHFTRKISLGFNLPLWFNSALEASCKASPVSFLRGKKIQHLMGIMRYLRIMTKIYIKTCNWALSSSRVNMG